MRVAPLCVSDDRRDDTRPAPSRRCEPPPSAPLGCGGPTLELGNGTAWSSRTTGRPSAAAGGSSWPPWSPPWPLPRASRCRPRRSTSPRTRLFVSTSESDSSSAYTGNLFATQRVASYADLVDQPAARGPGERRRSADELDPDELIEHGRGQRGAGDGHPRDHRHRLDPAVARDIAQAYAEELTELVKELETPDGEARAPIKATIVDNAEVTTSPVSPQPLRNLALAAVLGLLLGVGARCGPRAARHLAVHGRRRRRGDGRADPGQHRHRRRRQPARRSRSSARPPRGPRPSGCCAPTCSTSRSTTSRRSS